jgi:hypothetical protein
MLGRHMSPCRTPEQSNRRRASAAMGSHPLGERARRSRGAKFRAARSASTIPVEPQAPLALEYRCASVYEATRPTHYQVGYTPRCRRSYAHDKPIRPCPSGASRSARARPVGRQTGLTASCGDSRSRRPTVQARRSRSTSTGGDPEHIARLSNVRHWALGAWQTAVSGAMMGGGGRVSAAEVEPWCDESR